MGVCCSNTTETQSQEAVEEAVAVTDTSQSDWERLGGGEIEQPLRAELVKCVDSRFLVDHLQRGGRIERMQDLPSNAFISLEDLKRLGVYTCDFYQPAKVTYEWLPIIIVSYAWLGRSHPDPHAETLRVLVKALERMNPHGVIIDFTSLPQVPRTDEENKLFKEGLQMFNIFYSHPHTVWMGSFGPKCDVWSVGCVLYQLLVIAVNQVMCRLDLSSNEVGPEAMKTLWQGLKVNTSLTSMNLQMNDIRAEGAQHIAEGLKANSTLTMLDLTFTMIGDEGGKHMAEALKVNSALTNLYLGMNKIGGEAAECLKEAARQGCAVHV